MNEFSDTIAVALKYDGLAAPQVTAKDSGQGGENIIELARQYGIPLHEDPALAQILSQIQLGESIPEDLFVIVAGILAFAYTISGQTPPINATITSKD
ncbi:EscU/YscU/HrcU family type III secretion system export apparatus switch protein [Gammaproteobacteria bacterium AH-315-C21]|nr:EscU/YscU/HrcU family type III secretion system export apparatus switch protein [Gammaproteobacteria bacterium AH-315-C21]